MRRDRCVDVAEEVVEVHRSFLVRSFLRGELVGFFRSRSSWSRLPSFPQEVDRSFIPVNREVQSVEAIAAAGPLN